MRKRIVAILPVVIPDAGRSHSSERHGLDKHENVGLIYSTPTERQGLQYSVDSLLVATEYVTGEGFRQRLDFVD